MSADFRWIDEVTPEDQGWFLHEIGYRFGKDRMFKHKLPVVDLEEVGTISRLSTYIEAQLRKLFTTVAVYDERTKKFRVPPNAFQRRQHTPPQIAVPIG